MIAIPSTSLHRGTTALRVQVMVQELHRSHFSCFA